MEAPGRHVPRAFREAVPSSVWLQRLLALTVRELVEDLGLSGREAARRLGISPAAVSQYLTGKRLTRALDGYTPAPAALRLAHALAREALGSPPPEVVRPERLLQAASSLAGGVLPGEGPLPRLEALVPGVSQADRRRLRGLHHRIAAEQRAVSDCMRLAQRARDELTRAIFRQIASDSLRHAEIVASLASYLERGVREAPPSGITRADVERLRAREAEAEAGESQHLSGELGGVLSLLAASMEADERKHEALLEGLLRGNLSLGSRRTQKRR